MVTEREMTLDEWVNRLPSVHFAHREYTILKAENERLTALNAELVESAHLLCDEIGAAVPDEPQEFDASNFWRAFAQLQSALAKAEAS